MHNPISENSLIRRLKLNQLMIFERVLETRSVIRAANELNLTQPAVTRVIQELESYFDGPLFSRSNRGVMPTDLGVLLGRRVKSLMAEFRYMTDEVNDFRLGTSGHVIVGTLIAASARLLYMSRTLNAKTALNDGHQLAAVDGGSSPTVFGLRGVEDLGGGAKVRFTLESGVWRDQQFQRQFLRASGLYFSGRQAG